MFMSGSFRKYKDLKNQAPRDSMEIGGRLSNDASHLDRFMHELEIVKEDVKSMDKLRNRLNETNEESKTVPDAAKMKELRARMDSDVDHVSMLAKSIKKRVEALEFMSSTDTIDRTMISVVMGLGKKLRDMMDEFQGLRVKMATVYKETVESKYYSITGEKQYIEAIENLASTGRLEDSLEEAIQEHGRDRVVDFFQEVQERREGSKNMQRNLVELHQAFLDTAAVVEGFGQKESKSGGLGRENQVVRESSFMKSTGAAQLLDQPDHYDMEARRRAKFAIAGAVTLVVMILIPLFVNESFRDLE
ncbi:unnamed protein product [Coffea canephora]|uniref:Syntaxin N-terminal domain-containing protein n=1 Tax=Coffea canephora TaxID=49390 RepID=A0A068TW99_COFCA|nr:unnamed protein product [Coffea canephora]